MLCFDTHVKHNLIVLAALSRARFVATQSAAVLHMRENTHAFRKSLFECSLKRRISGSELRSLPACIVKSRTTSVWLHKHISPSAL